MLSHAHLHVLLNWVYALVMGGYCLLVLVLSVLWARMKTVLKPNTIISTVTITVLLPVRNEEDSIVACLQSIAEQDFPADRLEVLVLDDDSTDRTAELVAKFIQSRTTAMHIQLIHLPPVPGLTAHKKRALDIGVQTARGELIVTTDGDCVSGPHWLSTLAAFYEAQKPKLIAGPVAIEPGNTLFGKMQALEFSGLMAVGGASAAAGVPLLCNGANLAYPRAVFLELGGYAGDETASGDDMMLLKKIQRAYPVEVSFLKSADALVWTGPKESLGGFLQQRKRWASKFKRLGFGPTALVALWVFGCNLLLLLGLPLYALFPSFRGLYLILAGSKGVIDFLFLFLAISFIRKKQLLWVYLPEQLVYSLYVVFSAFTALKKGYDWKGRRN